MEQIEALERGLNDYLKLKELVNDKDIELKTIKFEKVMTFLDKVQARMSLNKRYDLFCYTIDRKKYHKINDHKINEIKPMSEVKRGDGVISLFERGIGTRNYKESHTRFVDLLSKWNNTQHTEAKEILNVLTKEDNKWVYENIKDQTTKLVMDKFLVIASKYKDLFTNRGNQKLDMGFSKKVKLPTKMLNIDDYRDVAEVKNVNIVELSVDTDNLSHIDIDYDTEERYLTERIWLNNYKQYYITQQNFNEFLTFMKEYKQAIKDKKEELYSLMGEIETDVEKVKEDLAHIFVIDCI